LAASATPSITGCYGLPTGPGKFLVEGKCGGLFISLHDRPAIHRREIATGAAHFDFAFLFFLDADLARPLAVLLTRLVLRVVFTLLPMDFPQSRCEPSSMQPKPLRVTGRLSLSEQRAAASGFSEREPRCVCK
jgi:hypothetical protein